MKRTQASVLLGAAALLMASAATAQERRAGSDIKISKEAPGVSKTPSGSTVTVVGGDVRLATPFDISAYSALNEKQITMLMASGDSLEIEIGHLAHGKGTDQRVRDYGMMLANDHTAHLTKTWEIIKDEDVGIAPIPNDVEGRRLREMLTWLQNNPASATWDATLLRFQAQHHQNVIDILNQNMKNAHDDDLEDHIKKSLTSLAKHRDMAKSIATTLGVSMP
jgi:putative membrane protein